MGLNNGTVRSTQKLNVIFKGFQQHTVSSERGLSRTISLELCQNRAEITNRRSLEAQRKTGQLFSCDSIKAEWQSKNTLARRFRVENHN